MCYIYKGNYYIIVSTEQKYKDESTGEWITLVSYSPVDDLSKVYHRRTESFYDKFVSIQT